MKTTSKRGSALAVTMIFVLALAVIAASILSLSLNSHRLTMRNDILQQAAAVADSELEALYYKFNYQNITGTADVASIPRDLGVVDVAAMPIPGNDRLPLIEIHRQEGWRVRRSMIADTEVMGSLPDSTKRGWFTNVTVRVEVAPPPDTYWTDKVVVRYGRVFVATRATIFQSCVFFQNCDLELTPSGITEFYGDIVSNGSIYMGAKLSDSDGDGVPDYGSLTLYGNVTYLEGKGFNVELGADGYKGVHPVTGIDDDPPVSATTRWLKPGTLEYFNKLAGLASDTYSDPVFAYGQANQLKTMKEPENLLGGVDAVEVATANPNLFGPLVGGVPTAEAINNVYRSLLVPPPAAGNTNEGYLSSTVPDEPTIAAQRVYNKAGLIITVNAATNTCTVTKQVNGVQTAIPLTALPGVIKEPTPGTFTKDIHDAREGSAGPGTEVSLLEIDVEKLKDFVGVGKAYGDFNGVLYINQMSGNSTHPAAVRLINAGEVPKTLADDGSSAGGFSVATNGGIYVQGNYNTTKVADATGTPVIVPSMLMGDAITVLSDDWNDANGALGCSSRIAKSDTIGADGNGLTTINAGLLTGNVPPTAGAASGGVQNLVRYLEDWGKESQTVSISGSLGRLFDSRMFTRAWRSPNSFATTDERFYVQPRVRKFTYQSSFIDRAPPGAPVTPAITRGRFFQW